MSATHQGASARCPEAFWRDDEGPGTYLYSSPSSKFKTGWTDNAEIIEAGVASFFNVTLISKTFYIFVHSTNKCIVITFKYRMSVV